MAVDTETSVPIPRQTGRYVATSTRDNRDFQQIIVAGFGGVVLVSPTTVATVPVPLPADALTNRKSILVQNHGTQTVFCGGEDVAASNGNGMKVEAGAAMLFNTGPALLYAVVASGTALCAVMEVS